MIKKWISTQNYAAKHSYVNEEQTKSVRSINDATSKEIFRIVTLDGEIIPKDDDELPDPPFFRLIREPENVKLWNTLNVFKYQSSNKIICNDSIIGRSTASDIWKYIFDQLVQIENQYGDDLLQLMKRQQEQLINLRKRFQNALLGVKEQQQENRLVIFVKQIYGIDLNTEEGKKQLEALREKVAPYVEACCDKFGRLSPLAVAYKRRLNIYFHQIYEQIATEKAAARAAGYEDELTIFNSVSISDVADYIGKAVSEANTFLSSITVNGQPFKNLTTLANQAKSITSLTQLRMECGDLCKGLSYFSTPKSFLDDLANIIVNNKNKVYPSGFKGATVESLIDTYLNMMQKSTSSGLNNKYYNGIRASVFKYPPGWLIKKQNEQSGDGRPRKKPEEKLLDQIEREKKKDIFNEENDKD